MQSNDCDSSAGYCLVDASPAGKRAVKTASERRRSGIGNLVLSKQVHQSAGFDQICEAMPASQGQHPLVTIWVKISMADEVDYMPLPFEQHIL
jgi:hypothetical protein